MIINVTGARGAGKSTLVWAALDATSGFADVRRLELTGQSVTSALAGLRHRLSRMPISVRRGDAQGEDRTVLHLERADMLTRSARELFELVSGRGRIVIVLESVPRMRAPGVGVVYVGPLNAADAEELFRRRAGSVAAGFDRDKSSTAYIRRICAVVDANPLAIELAAVRLSMMSLAALATVLESPEHSLAILSRPATVVTGPARGVRADLAEGHEATSPAAQRLLDVLSVFEGSFGLEAVEAVSAGVLTHCYDSLGELLDLRLVELDSASGAGRYRLSRLVRGFAAERLAASGGRPAAQGRRATYYCELARRASAAFDDVEEDEAERILGEDFAEALAALRWLRGDDPRRALRLAADLGWAADRRGGSAGLMEVLVDLTRVELAGDQRPRRDALLWTAAIGSWSPLAADRSELIRGQLAEGVELARRLAEPLPLLRALRTQFVTTMALADIGSAIASCAEGIQVATRIGHVRWLGRFEIASGATQAVIRQYAEAARVGASGLARAIRSGDEEGIALGSLSLHAMPPEYVENRAELPPLEAVLEIFGNQRDVTYQAHTLATLAQEAIDAGDPVAAAEWTLRRLGTLGEEDLLHGLTICVMLGVHITRMHGDHVTGAHLHGSVASYVEPLLTIMAPVHAQLYRAGLDILRKALGDSEFDAQVARGQLLDRDRTLIEVTGYLRQVADAAPAAAQPCPRAEPHGVLTARELQVLCLLGRGLRNKEIAAELRVTPKTVMHHTVAIYRKLGVRGRLEAVTAATRCGLLPVS